MKEVKLLVLGRDGMLGNMLLQQANSNSLRVVSTSKSDYNSFIGTNQDTLIKFDATKDRIEKILDSHPDISHLVNCIGVVKQSMRAIDTSYMYQVNANFPLHISEIASERRIKMVHLSTDCVFSGLKGNYKETDLADPIDEYGLSKLQGEGAVDHNAMVIRTSIIGRETSQNKKGLLEWFLSMRGNKVFGYENVYFSGLTTMKLSEVILDIIETDKFSPGIWHVSSEKISKLNLLRKVNSTLSLGIEIIPTETPILDRSLNNEKSSTLLGLDTPDWDSMLSEMVWSDNLNGSF